LSPEVFTLVVASGMPVFLKMAYRGGNPQSWILDHRV